MPDQLFNALADRKRRRLLVALEEHVPEDDESLSGLVERTGGLSWIELYHVHLPKLSDAGIVEWDRETDEITAGPQFDDACQLLRLAGGRQTRASAD